MAYSDGTRAWSIAFGLQFQKKCSMPGFRQLDRHDPGQRSRCSPNLSISRDDGNGQVKWTQVVYGVYLLHAVMVLRLRFHTKPRPMRLRITRCDLQRLFAGINFAIPTVLDGLSLHCGDPFSSDLIGKLQAAALASSHTASITTSAWI